MRNLKKNKQKMYYSNMGAREPVLEKYVDADGNEYILANGESDINYTEPIEFWGSIANSGGDTNQAEYGLDLSQYEAVLVTDKKSTSITETSLIWLNTEPQMHPDGSVDEFSADYKVVKVSPSINTDKFVLKKVVK